MLLSWTVWAARFACPADLIGLAGHSFCAVTWFAMLLPDGRVRHRRTRQNTSKEITTIEIVRAIWDTSRLFPPNMASYCFAGGVRMEMELRDESDPATLLVFCR